MFWRADHFSDDMIHTVNNMELIFNEAFVREAAKRNNAINIYWKAEKPLRTPACECSQHEGTVFPCIVREKPQVPNISNLL